MEKEELNIHDESAAFEEALKREKEAPCYALRLFITGLTPNSMRAVSNIKSICKQYLGSNCSLEIIDVYQNSELAKGENIIVTPTLVRKSPGPATRMVGDLSDTEKVLNLLEIKR